MITSLQIVVEMCEAVVLCSNGTVDSIPHYIRTYLYLYEGCLFYCSSYLAAPNSDRITSGMIFK